MISRYKKMYKEELAPQLKKSLNKSSLMDVPSLEKITLNMGVGTAVENKNEIEVALNEMTAIVGQKAVKTFAKNSVSNFKIREGNAIGVKVTLRGERMYDFFDKLINLSLPAVRDFRGLSRKSFDGRGNYSIGIKEQLIFPEISYENVQKIRGMDITITTNAKNDNDALALFESFGFPFRKKVN